MKSLIGNLLFAAILLLIATRFLSVYTGTFFPIDIVSSDSMTPSLMQGDLIAWTPARIDDVKVGDVIVFKSWNSWPDQKLVVHRVVEIRTDFGKPAFVTKGDANNYTDQSGPHIPEPYVIEKNFIGKTLSIGNQPLKIPLIGMIGMWINQGFQLLSQPSAAKGAVTSVGVFTPLILSVILLVTSLFILPERAKTIREKIRFNIFGAQSLSIKNSFVFFLSIFIIFFIVIHLFAYDSTSATVGVGEFPEQSGFELGSLKPGQTSFPRQLPITNPSILPVKGILFGKGELASFINRDVFTVDRGKVKNTNVTATAPNGTINGTFAGEIMIYSSPVWFMYPDSVMKDLVRWNGQGAVYILDILAACILTALTIALILISAFIGNKYQLMKINLSWHYAPKLYMKKGVGQRLGGLKTRTRQKLIKRFGWLSNMNLATFDAKPIIIGSVLVIPLLLLLNSEILAMVIASLFVGLVAYALNCRLRRKIVLASVVAMIISIIFISFKINYFMLTRDKPLIESLGLGMGTIGIYLLTLAFFLVPLAFISWYFTHKLRNVKERKDPLLVLEGRCDL
jgi:signal peptidase I